MKRMRLVLAAALLVMLVVPALALEHAFMGFDVATQKMYAVVIGDQPFHAEITYTQSNPDGYIGNDTTYVPQPVEVWEEAALSPTDPDRFTDIPDGVTNVITAFVDIYDATGENFLYRMTVTDTLLANVDGPEGFYTYLDGSCTPILPDSIRINSSFCAWICHGSYSVPIVCEDPGYNPELLEVSVANGCSPTETHCNDSECPRVDSTEFRWFKRVYPGCRLYLTMTYCNAAPGCVCIWRSDFYLPVEMVPGSFRALAGDSRVNISWATASETSTQHFVVTRSDRRDDGFVTVYSTAAAGNSTSRRDYSWTDTGVRNGETYYYKLHVIDAEGNHVYNENGATVVVSATPGTTELPQEYSLGNYPNPFNSQTTFNFSIAEAGHVTLRVYDLLGREIATVVDRELAANSYNVSWSANDLPAGVYMYTLTSGNFTQTRKMLYLK